MNYGFVPLDEHPHISDYKETDFRNPNLFDSYQLSLDSGAHTLYNRKFAGAEGIKGQFSRAYSKYDFFHSEEFRTYLKRYIEHLHEAGHLYTFYVTLDIIFEPQLSWDVTTEMEQQGLKPIPVFHYGEDFSWFKKMMDKYEYIGIGGLGQDITKAKFREWANKLFEILCGGKTKDGIWKKPNHKTHGFAIAAPTLLFEYPWYTCDSSTWTTLGRTGTIYIPKPIFQNNLDIIGFNYAKPTLNLPVTARRNGKQRHADHLTETFRDIVDKFLGFYGIDLYACKYDYDARDIVNIWYFRQLEKQAKKFYKEVGYDPEGGNLLLAGTPSGASTGLNRNINLYYKLRAKNLHLLNSFWYKTYMHNCLKMKQGLTDGKELYQLRNVKKTASFKRRPMSIPDPLPNITSLTRKKVERKPLLLKKPLPKKYTYAYDDDSTSSILVPHVEAKPRKSTVIPKPLTKRYNVVVEYTTTHYETLTLNVESEDQITKERVASEFELTNTEFNSILSLTISPIE